MKLESLVLYVFWREKLREKYVFILQNSKKVIEKYVSIPKMRISDCAVRKNRRTEPDRAKTAPDRTAFGTGPAPSLMQIWAFQNVTKSMFFENQNHNLKSLI